MKNPICRILWLAILLLSLLCILVAIRSTQVDVSGPEVTIHQGTLRGVNRQTYLGRNIASFLGIPYAEPPVGPRRFMIPVPAAAWEGTFIADDDGHVCPQMRSKMYFGDEDCLHLNVHTPYVPNPGESDQLLPTMVYVFGGAYIKGDDNSTTKGPQHLLERDVVLVVPNYRLGPLGFLSTGDKVVPGNMGLKDLVMVFRWVRQNIAFFGGDPDRVTLFGHSSGATTAHLLSLSPLMRGLFHRLITQSGSALSAWAFTPSEMYAKNVFKFGNWFNCSTHNSIELVDCLRHRSAWDLVHATPKFHPTTKSLYITWSPTNESDVEGACLPDNPDNLMANGYMADVPWISGVARNEGLAKTSSLHKSRDLFEKTIIRFDDYILNALFPYYLPFNLTEYLNDIKSYYFNDVTADRRLLLKNVTDLVGDILYTHPIWVSLRRQVKLAKNPIYFYTFEYVGTLSYAYLYSGSDEIYGVAHGDELIYLFDQSDYFSPLNRTLSRSDLAMSKTMVDLWTSFARDGVPLTCYENGTTIWHPFDPSENNLLQIGNGHSTTPVVINTLPQRDDRMPFVDELISKYGFYEV